MYLEATFFSKKLYTVIQEEIERLDKYSLSQQQKGAHRMNLVSRLSRTQLLLIVLVIVSLLVATFFVIHAAMPGLWRTIADTPDVLIGWH